MTQKTKKETEAYAKSMKLIDYMWETHGHYIEAIFGDRADTANMGWAQGDDFIESKIYARGDEPAMVAITKMTKQGKGVTITHKSVPYKP